MRDILLMTYKNEGPLRAIALLGVWEKKGVYP